MKNKTIERQRFNRDVYAVIDQYVSLFPNEKARLSRLLAQITNASDLTDRKNYLGHVTASALVIDTERNILLVHHKTLQKWLLPGGHYEIPEKIADCPIREAHEETGIENLQLDAWHAAHKSCPLDIDTHSIPENTKKGELAHFHHDFCYLVRTSNKSIKMDPDEVCNVGWYPIEVARKMAPRPFLWEKAYTRI